MPHITVTCRCTRPMRQEPGRRAGYLMCSCGNRVRLDDHRGQVCEVPDADGETCREAPVMKHPITLCSRHIRFIAGTEAFATASVRQNIALAYQESQHNNDEKRRRAERFRDEQARVYEKLRIEQSQVYYVAIRGLIKIGFTTNMTARMRALMPDAVLATEPGGRQLEKRRHRQFQHLRADLGREYFNNSPELDHHVQEVLDRHGPPNMTGYPDVRAPAIRDALLLSVRDAAKANNIPVRTLYEWIEDKRLTVVLRDGKKRGTRVDAKQVEQLVELRKSGRLPRLDRCP